MFFSLEIGDARGAMAAGASSLPGEAVAAGVDDDHRSAVNR